MTYQSFEIYKIKIIKVVTFNVNPKFTEVQPNSIIFAMDDFCTNPARKFGIIDLTHEASFCFLYFVNEI